MTGTELALVVPDPRNQTVPVGWFEHAALPVIAATDDWDALDEYEARLRAFASYIDAFDGDSVEFEKALRVIEKRRGELIGADLHQGKQLPPSVAEVGASEQTQNRWRKLARHWEELWPVVRDTRKRSDVTQAALLKRIEMGAHYSSNTDEWATPADLFAVLDSEFSFELDVCALPGDYRFDIQLAEGLAAEGWFYELTKGGDRFEVKHDRLALETGNVYVERENNPGHEGWKPSGIETTEADCWIFVIGIPPAAFIGIETSQLRMLVQNVGRAVEQPNGSCPTRGVAVPLTFLIGHLHDPVAFPGIE